MLTAILILTGVQVYLELKICNKFPVLHRLNRRSPMFGFALSIVLSMFAAFAFGAAGMIVLVAGLLSTGITQVYYSLGEETYNSLHSRIKQFRMWFVCNKDQWYANFMVCVRLIQFAWAFVTYPIKLFFGGARRLDSFIAKRRGI